MTMQQRGFLLDPNKCLGCRSCILACAANKKLAPGLYLRSIEEQEKKIAGKIHKYFLSSACNHCKNPECIRLCPREAISKRKDGIVIHDPERCDGCGTCTRSCPFGAPVINNLTGKMIKCDMCHDRIDDGRDPACVSACPVQALQLIEDISSFDKELREYVTNQLPGVVKIQVTRPSLRYKEIKIGMQSLRKNGE